MTSTSRSKPDAGDGAFKPTTFTRESDGETKELTAHSPADAVRLTFDGWKDSGSLKASAPARSTTSTTAAGNAGA
jgi:hypothetical protein